MYEVTVKKIEKVTRIVRGEYGVVECRPYTDEEVAKANSSWQASDEKVTATRDIMGYQPNKEITETVTREIYTQEVEEIDLVAVINAVNKGAQS